MNENNSKINTSLFQCWVCESTLEPFMTFGRMPIANNFLSEKEFNDEYFFEMEPAFCNTCKTFQLVRQPEPQQMFNEKYAFFSGTSNYTVNQVIDFIKYFIDDLQIDLVDNKIMNQLSYEVSTDKIESLGFVFKDNLGDGIEQTISLLRNSNWV